MKNITKLRIRVHANKIQGIAESLYNKNVAFEDLQERLCEIVAHAESISTCQELQVSRRSSRRNDFTVIKPGVGNENAVIQIDH